MSTERRRCGRRWSGWGWRRAPRYVSASPPAQPPRQQPKSPIVAHRSNSFYGGGGCGCRRWGQVRPRDGRAPLTHSRRGLRPPGRVGGGSSPTCCCPHGTFARSTLQVTSWSPCSAWLKGTNEVTDMDIGSLASALERSTRRSGRRSPASDGGPSAWHEGPVSRSRNPRRSRRPRTDTQTSEYGQRARRRMDDRM